MNKGHDFKFIGGDILSKIGAAWFVSFAYNNYIDKKHIAWKNQSFSNLSIQSRKNNYNKSTEYHYDWLLEILKMTQLDKHKNKCGLSANQIQSMAKEILKKIKDNS